MDRKALVTRHFPQVAGIDLRSPLSVGNGGFAFTVDVTGLQTLYDTYDQHANPLCTMSDWGWHVTPTEGGKPYELTDIEHTSYQHQAREIKLPVEKKSGSEVAYGWLRENPHRCNLITLELGFNRDRLWPKLLENTQQTLDLYRGVIISQFEVQGEPVKVTTWCDSEQDMLAFIIETELKGLTVDVTFSYGASNISGAAWESPEKHQSQTQEVAAEGQRAYHIQRTMDELCYDVKLVTNSELKECDDENHYYRVTVADGLTTLLVDLSQEDRKIPSLSESLERTERAMARFWEKTGLVDFSGSKDPRATELERRMVLSLYLSKIQGTGTLPPQETGLTCNSWHGKHHLEMHLWHSAYLPLFNHGELLLNSLPWYKEILPKAIENAAKNGYQGARWPKQVAGDGIDSPSVISPLLVWQQPHIVYLLELVYQNQPKDQVELLSEYWEVVLETAKFMCDYLTYDEAKDRYSITAPVIPAQEEFDPLTVLNPAFEVAYFKFGLDIAIKWATRLGKTEHVPKWQQIHDKIASLPMANGLYLSHENAPDTFERYNKDHPAMLMAYGLIPYEGIDETAMRQTLEKVIQVWEYETMWGWDFAVMAMTAHRLGDLPKAIELLLMDTPKNAYVTSGNNYQNGPLEAPIRRDLPLYLPGNGSLLLAMAHLFGEYSGQGQMSLLEGQWQIKVEGITTP